MLLLVVKIVVTKKKSSVIVNMSEPLTYKNLVKKMKKQLWFTFYCSKRLFKFYPLA